MIGAMLTVAIVIILAVLVLANAERIVGALAPSALLFVGFVAFLGTLFVLLDWLQSEPEAAPVILAIAVVLVAVPLGAVLVVGRSRTKSDRH